jgi:hypothetical protein
MTRIHLLLILVAGAVVPFASAACSDILARGDAFRKYRWVGNTLQSDRWLTTKASRHIRLSDISVAPGWLTYQECEKWFTWMVVWISVVRGG